MRIVALIPIRAGSKGIKNKNIKQMCGRPLFSWVMEAAVNSKLINEVWISTESKSYASLASEYFNGVNIHNRPKHLATDSTSTDAVIVDFTKKFKYDLLVTLQATNPFTRSEHVDAGIKHLLKQKYDSVLSTAPINRFVWPSETPLGTYPINYNVFERPRRQDGITPVHIENGAFYITRRKVVEDFNNRLGGKIGIYDMPKASIIEIDEPTDWELAEQVLSLYNKGTKML